MVVGSEALVPYPLALIKAKGLTSFQTSSASSIIWILSLNNSHFRVFFIGHYNYVCRFNTYTYVNVMLQSEKVLGSLLVFFAPLQTGIFPRNAEPNLS